MSELEPAAIVRTALGSRVLVRILLGRLGGSQLKLQRCDTLSERLRFHPSTIQLSPQVLYDARWRGGLGANDRLFIAALICHRLIHDIGWKESNGTFLVGSGHTEWSPAPRLCGVVLGDPVHRKPVARVVHKPQSQGVQHIIGPDVDRAAGERWAVDIDASTANPQNERTAGHFKSQTPGGW